MFLARSSSKLPGQGAAGWVGWIRGVWPTEGAVGARGLPATASTGAYLVGKRPKGRLNGLEKATCWKSPGRTGARGGVKVKKLTR